MLNNNNNNNNNNNSDIRANASVSLADAVRMAGSAIDRLQRALIWAAAAYTAVKCAMATK